MTTQENLKLFHDWVKRMSAYHMALALLGIDKQTLAPVDGSEFRDERMAILAGELFSITTDPRMAELRKTLLSDEAVTGDDRKMIELYDHDISKILSVPKDEYVAFNQLQNESYGAWLKAKNASDYSMFEPYLKRIIEAQKKMYSYRSSDLDLYDQMLDDFEPGMTREKYDVFFDKVKERLVPLIRRVTEAEQIDTSFIETEYPVELQKKYMEHMLAYLHFDKSWGYQNETEHPFTSGLCENDIRVTTKYLPDRPMSALLSTIHETGHGYYMHQVAPEYDGTIFNEGVSSGMHESQSRLCENYLGRSKPFWEANYPALKEVFPEQLKDIGLDQFLAALNAAQPSLIRTEADELTYPLHIVIRYELERGLFEGTISTEGLDKTWDDMYEKYLGVRASSAKEGILQDVHWADGSFGYFPTYALGSAFSAQFMHAMRKDIDVDDLLRNSHYDVIMNWLKEHIHKYGCRYNADEIMHMATGEAFDPNYYLDYLEDKYTKLYHLD
ncbi:MAG: carboxypeptidase M32 [Solobacterium sp.]|nr:carboxypeptidase M32 [Solobacterium sp.]